MEINICIAKNMVEFVSKVKTFNGKYLEMRSSGDTKVTIVNKPFVFIPPYLDTSMQSHDTIVPTYINKNNNNIYEGLIQSKTTKSQL